MPSCYLLLASPVQKSSKPVFLKARTQPHSSPSIQAETKKPRSLCPENRTFLAGVRKKRGLGVMLRISKMDKSLGVGQQGPGELREQA